MREMGNWRAYLMERLAGREKAISYLDVALEEYQVDSDTPFFLVGLQNVVEAQGGVSTLAKQIGIESEVLLEVLSSEDAPRLDMFINIVTALGCRLSIAPMADADQSIEVADEDYPTVQRGTAASKLEVTREQR